MKDSQRKIIRKKAPSDEEQRLKRYSANSRERQRTQEINSAFNMLRRIIPSMPADKMSKIHTLRIATAYIAYLAEMLSGQSDFEAIDCNPQTSFHVWRSAKAQQQLSTSVTTLTLLDSKRFGRYSALPVYPPSSGYSTGEGSAFCKTEWIERDGYSTNISYTNASTFSNQSKPPSQSQCLIINHRKE